MKSIVPAPGKADPSAAEDAKDGSDASEPRRPDVIFPPDAGVIDVKKDFGARGDGTTDDTQALNRAFAKAKDNMSIVYLPAGTYLVSEPVRLWFWTYTQGQSRDKTVIRLRDACPGYTDPQKTRWMLTSIDDTPDQWGRRDPAFSPQVGNCNMAFAVSVCDLTLDTGKGNPGAIACHFISNNGGGFRNVNIRSGDGAGFIGLDLRRNQPGPCFFQDVKVQGFDYGVVTKEWSYTVTFERLTLEDQRKAGFYNNEHSTTIRGLTSRNKVPALLNASTNDSGGPVVLLDAECTGGGSTVNAVESIGPIYVRNLSCEGYKNALLAQGKAIPGPSVKRFSTRPFEGTVRVDPVATAPLDLPVMETPVMPWMQHEQWVNVLKYEPDSVMLGEGKWRRKHWVAADAIQKAIDSGKPTVYLPKGNYFIDRTIVVRGKVQVIEGCGSRICISDALKGQAVFRVEKTAAPVVFFDRLHVEDQTWAMPRWFIEHAGPSAVVIQNSMGPNYRNLLGAGNLYINGLCGQPPFEFNANSKAWLRDLNCEGEPTKLINRGADLWILGWKTEGTGTSLVASGPKARTEILGGLMMPWAKDMSQPGFALDGGAKLTLMIGFFGCHTTVVREEIGGKTTDLLYQQVKDQSKADRFIFYSNSAKPEPGRRGVE